MSEGESLQNTVKGVEFRVAHCHDYHSLLNQHFKEHESLCPGKWKMPQDKDMQRTSPW